LNELRLLFDRLAVVPLKEYPELAKYVKPNLWDPEDNNGQARPTPYLKPTISIYRTPSSPGSASSTPGSGPTTPGGTVKPSCGCGQRGCKPGGSCRCLSNARVCSMTCDCFTVRGSCSNPHNIKAKAEGILPEFWAPVAKGQPFDPSNQD
jgi:hypothetical protein